MLRHLECDGDRRDGVLAQRPEHQHHVDGQPGEGEADDDDQHHPDDPLLVLDALGGGAPARRRVPQAVEHHRVQDDDQEQRQAVGRHEEGQLAEERGKSVCTYYLFLITRGKRNWIPGS